jgi:hypothetical protein
MTTLTDKEREQRARIRKSRAIIKLKKGAAHASEYLRGIVGASTPSEILAADLDLAEQYLAYGERLASGTSSPTLPEGNVPAGFAARVMDKWNAPKKRGDIAFTVPPPADHPEDGERTIIRRNPHEEVHTSPRDPAEIQEELEEAGLPPFNKNARSSAYASAARLARIKPAGAKRVEQLSTEEIYKHWNTDKRRQKQKR